MNEPPALRTDGAPLHELDGADVWALPVLPAGDGIELGPGAADVEDRCGVDLLAVAESARCDGRAGTVVAHPLPDGPLLVLVGVGARSPADLRAAGAALARVHGARGTVASTAWTGPADAAAGFVEGLLLASFRLTYRTTAPARAPVDTFVLAGLRDSDTAARSAVRRGEVFGLAGWRARAIATTPAREKTPQQLAAWAQEHGAAAGLDRISVWDEDALADHGCGGILGVGRASAHPPRLIRLDHRPRRRRGGAGHVVLVGKGITFDTGGLSLKPPDAMMTMKRDVTGGAVVLAVMTALRDLDVGLRVTGLVAAAENAIGADAQRPGDVVTHPGGRTTEVLNTDAEGRLVLADALAYAAAELDPTVLVDVSTLTGAVKTALGTSLGGLYATDDALATALLAAGRDAGEPLWRLPLVDDYADDNASLVADSRNLGGASPTPSGAGSIAAALYLRPFAAGVPWAHLDLSSVGDATRDAGVWTPGPTGFGARLLLRWLTAADPLAGVG